MWMWCAFVFRPAFFTPVMMKRLAKLGINKTDPSTLTPEEISKFVRLDFDPARVTWRRSVDVNDRLLRGITIGKGSQEASYHVERDTGFDIAVASEVMAVLALSKSVVYDSSSRVGVRAVSMP